MKKYHLLLIIIVFLSACHEKSAKPTNQKMPEPIIQAIIKAHGWLGNELKAFEFTFRDIDYRFHHTEQGFKYEREGVIKGDSIHDVLENNQLSRRISGQTVELSKEERMKYSESVNSVIYFATLPLKLSDQAVQSNKIGTASIQATTYELLKVTFAQENGGVDHEDEFLYWINQKTHEIDYLAYNYQVNGGGVRFRKAIQKRKVDGVLFQDYINYKAPKGTNLAKLGEMWQNQELDSLSVIQLQNVKALY